MNLTNFLQKLGTPVDYQFEGNSLQSYVTALAVFLVSYFVIQRLRRFLTKKFKKLAARSPSVLNDSLAGLFEDTNRILIVSVSVFLGCNYLVLSFRPLLEKIILVILILQIGVWASHFASIWLASRLSQDASKASALELLNFLAKFLIWTVVLLVTLDNLGVNVTALVTGLGVGGVAIALAVQSILSDLLSSLSIVLDKPFEVGDNVIVGDVNGTVERIGIKTTRIRSVTGEQVVLSNSDLLSSRIRNLKRLLERRVLFRLGVVYGTSSDTLAAIPTYIRESVEGETRTRFDRAHFKEFGDSALVFEVAYYVLSNEYSEYVQVEHQVNLAINRRFEKEGIEFAYPTQTVHLIREG